MFCVLVVVFGSTESPDNDEALARATYRSYPRSAVGKALAWSAFEATLLWRRRHRHAAQ